MVALRREIILSDSQSSPPFISPRDIYWGFPGGSDGKESACNVGGLGSTPRLGRSPGEGTGNPLQYSCLENPVDRGAWWTAVHGVTKSWTRATNTQRDN